VSAFNLRGCGPGDKGTVEGGRADEGRERGNDNLKAQGKWGCEALPTAWKNLQNAPRQVNFEFAARGRSGMDATRSLTAESLAVLSTSRLALDRKKQLKDRSRGEIYEPRVTEF
jgi:hypothetical protein